MTNLDKFWKALLIVKPNTQLTVKGDINSEEDFNNNIKWNTGVDENNRAITTTTNPHSEITWTKVKQEMDKL
tara:strand:- start:31 stop:246 length:216 start_codon:yes stop_codon:yes gene_type:complete